MEKCSCGKVPCVILPGIGQSKTGEYDENGNLIRVVWPFDIESDPIVKRMAFPAIKMLVTRHDCGFAQKLADVFMEQVDGILNKKDGSPKHNIKPITYDYSLAGCTAEEKHYIYRMVPVPTLEDKLGADHIWFFSYNSFGQNYEIVDDLRAFIKNVKEVTGHDKVNLLPISLGGTIATAYLDKYGDDCDINRVVSIVPAYDGTQAIADLLADDIKYSEYADVFEVLFGKSTTEKITKYLRFVPKNEADTILRTTMRRIADDVFKNSVTMWGAVPANQYEALRDRLIPGDEYAALREQTDRAYIARRDFEKTVRREQARGVRFYDICCHGLQIFEFCKSDRLDSDHIVHSRSASMYAHFAALGETLPDNYVQQNTNCNCEGHNHISPDRTVDASVGLMPDTTWYFKGQSHDEVQHCKPVLETAEWLIMDENEKDVYCDPLHPQFTTIK